MDDAEKIRQQLAKAGASGESVGDGTLFGEPVLIVNQKAKLFEGSSEFSVFRADGARVGSVRQVGQTKVKKVLKAVSNLDMFMSARYEIVDATGQIQLVLEKPRTFIKGRMSVQRADGTEVGSIQQKLRFGKVKLLLLAGGSDEQVGELDAENFRGWNFTITDMSGQEVARVSKTWAGLGKEMFTTADNYVLERKVALEDPLLSMTVASALTIDLLLKQFKA